MSVDLRRHGFLLTAGALGLGLVLLALLVRRLQGGSSHGSGAAVTVEGSRPGGGIVSRGSPRPPDPAIREPALESPASSVRVITQDPMGRPLAGAEVALLEDIESPLGVTDAAGELQVSLTSTYEHTVVATLEGYGPAELVLTPPFPPRAILTLVEAGQLVGRVAWVDGTAVGSGFRVAAWPDGYPPSEVQILGAREDAMPRGLQVAETDGAGRFTLRGLDPARGYTLTAGGHGGLTLDEKSGCRVGSTPVDLTATAVFGAVVRVREEGGAPLPVSDGVYGRGAGWVAPERDGVSAEPVLGLPRAYFLVATHHDPECSPARITNQLILASSPRPDFQLDGIQYEVDVPGFLPAHLTLSAAPVGQELPNYQVELQPSGQPTGSLEVLCKGTGFGVRPDSATEHRLGILTLVGEEGSRVTILVEKLCRDSRVYEGIPFGSYLARFQLNDWYLQIPEAGADPMPIRIGPVAGQFTIDLSGLGKVQAVLKDSSGREYTGGVTLRLFSNQGTRFLSFHSAPYLVEGVPAGRYWLAIDRLPGADRQRQVATAFEVLPDEVVMPELSIVH